MGKQKRHQRKAKPPSELERKEIQNYPSDEIDFQKPNSGNSNEIPSPNYVNLENGNNFGKPNDQEDLTRLVAELVLGIWKARQKIVTDGDNNPPEELKKVFRPLDATYQKLLQSGIEITDRINEPYRLGMTEHVLTFEPREDIVQDTIVETIKPTILYKQKVILTGEIIVGKASQIEKPRKKQKK